MNFNKNKLASSVIGASLFSLLSACGGDSASINENPNPEMVQYSNGCTDTDQRCQNFVIDYPISGLDFDCKADTINHFTTKMEGNVVVGGCPVGDTVQFSLQTTATAAKIILGGVDLSKINPLYHRGQPTQLSLMHLAVAMTGKEIVKDDLSDDTYKVLVGLVRLFQALGLEKGANQAGDIQHLELEPEDKKGLAQLESSVEAKDFINGSYVEKLKPWINVNQIDEATAVTVTQQLLNLSKVNIYSANMVPFKFGKVDIGGFFGESSLGTKAIANLYLINLRDGHTLGYAVQWTGTPKAPEGTTTDETLKRILMVSQFPPQKLTAAPQLNWVNTFNQKITRPLALTSSHSTSDVLSIYQGQFVNGNTVPGNEFVYKQATGNNKPAVDPTVYGAWKQTLNNDTYQGRLDLFKTNPATYLDKSVFKSEAKVKSGENYIFPLYANLIFEFEPESGLTPVKLGIVIDENGDIRSNLSQNSLASNQCPGFDFNSYKDQHGVQQYRIGTTGAVNNQTSDKSITLRMILANPAFNELDGAIIGLNETFLLGPNGNNPVGFTSGGVRINLQNLLVNPDVSKGINIQSWNATGALPAKWGNMHATMQKVYNANNSNSLTQEQRELAKREGGELKIELLDCYQIKKKL